MAVSSTGSENCEELQQAQAEITALDAEDLQLEEQIQNVKSALKLMTDTDEYQKRAFVTYNDIRNIASLKERTIIAIRAPSGTTLQVPDPDDGMVFPQRRFQIFLQSPSAPIKVYLLSNDEAAVAQQQQQQQQQEGSLVTTPLPDASAAAVASSSAAAEPKTPPTRSQQQAQQSQQRESTQNDADDNVQKLSPPPADPDFMYGMDANEGITDLYEEYDDMALGHQETNKQPNLFD